MSPAFFEGTKMFLRRDSPFSFSRRRKIIWHQPAFFEGTKMFAPAESRVFSSCRCKIEHSTKKYHLSDKKIFELQTMSPLSPFVKWKDGKTPIWWKGYTDIKHDRFRNKERATLNSTLEALGGLFLLFLNHNETMNILIDRDVVIRGGHPKPYSKSILSQGEPIQELCNQFYAKTSLFGYVFEDKFRQLDDEERKRILSPAYPGY